MKFVRFEKDDKISYGVLDGKNIAEISGQPFEKPLIYTKKIYSLEEVKILSPVTPSKIIGIGLNYAEHIKEMKDKRPAILLMISCFCSFTTSAIVCLESHLSASSKINVLPSSAIAPNPDSGLYGKGSFLDIKIEKSAFKYLAIWYPTSTPPLGIARTKTPLFLYFSKALASFLPASFLSSNIFFVIFFHCQLIF